jgi:hypothetical protein
MHVCGCVRQLEREDREAEVTFGQLGFFAYNMVKFEVPPDSVRSLMQKYSRFAKSSKAEWETLLSQVDMFISGSVSAFK